MRGRVCRGTFWCRAYADARMAAWVTCSPEVKSPDVGVRLVEET
jgi:hypothetical protein